MKISKKSIKAFSLIELSIVLLIIGIIIAGVTQGGRIISAMKLATAKSITQSSSVPSIKGLIMWLEPTLDNSFLDAESENGQEITVWKDVNPQSSIKLNASASGGAVGIKYDANTVSGLPSIKFSGEPNTKVLIASPIASNFASTVFVVYKLIETTNYSERYIYSWDTSYARVSLNFRLIGTSSNAFFIYGNTKFTTKPEIATIVMTGPLASDKIRLYVNGTLDKETDITAVSIVSNISVFKIGEGPQASNTGYNTIHGGHISEVIVFEGALKIADRKEVESYLGKKYGIKVN